MVNVEERDLILLFSQDEKHCLHKLNQAQQNSEPPDFVNSKHARKFFPELDVINAFPSVLKRVAVIMELRRQNI